MTIKTSPLDEITDEALTLRYRKLDATDTVRFLNQYGEGYGNYTERREMLFADVNLRKLVR